MPTSELDPRSLPRRGASAVAAGLWREWCFLRAVLQLFGVRLVFVVVLLIGGGLAFQRLEPDKQHSLPKAMYCTWALIFGNAVEDFPASPVLQFLFFAVPLLGLVVILESLIEFTLMLRDRRRNERSWCKIMAASQSQHVILVGLGKLGVRTFRLLRQLGESVVVIERDPDNQFLDEIRRASAPLLIGDARREALLDDANAAHAKSIILATNHDLTNLEVALDARRVQPKIRVVLRMFDQNMADKVRQGFNIQVAMSQSAISAPAFVMAAVEQSFVNSTVVDGQLVVMQRCDVRKDGPFHGQTVGQIMKQYNVGVVEHRPRGGTARLMPPPDAAVSDGDSLLVQGSFAVLKELNLLARG